jgi:sigma-E factor negative regulatory protein RseA
MEQRMRESLSALMDDEANELELERILAKIGEDHELRGAWVRYNAVRSLVSGQFAGDASVDISARVQRAISAEERVPAGISRQIPKLVRPVASFAVAASVAAVVVVGGLQITDMQATATDQPLVAVSPPGMVGTVGATPVRASFGSSALPTLQPATHTAYRELARQRMQRYMQEHAEAAALNTPQGLIPFARVNEIRE